MTSRQNFLDKFFGKNPYNTLVGGPIYGGHYHDSNLKELSLTLEEEGREKGFRGKELDFMFVIMAEVQLLRL